MAHTENTLNDKKKTLLHWHYCITYCECLGTLYNTVDNVSSKQDLVESSLVVTKTVNDNLLNRITMLERSLHAQEQYSRRECLEIVGIPVSIDDKNLQATACNILNEIDVPCGSEDLEDCHRIKGDCTITEFSSRRKSSEVLHEKKKLKNIDGSKFDFNAGVKLYINECLCPYHRGLWGNVRNSGWIKLFSCFTQLVALYVSKRSKWTSSFLESLSSSFVESFLYLFYYFRGA